MEILFNILFSPLTEILFSPVKRKPAHGHSENMQTPSLDANHKSKIQSINENDVQSVLNLDTDRKLSTAYDCNTKVYGDNTA